MTIGKIDSANLTPGQKVAVKYFSVAIVRFMAQIVFGLIAGLQFLKPDFLYNVLDFNVARMVHINAMIVWMLFAFTGCCYWLVEAASGTDLAGVGPGELNLWIFTLAIPGVSVLYLIVPLARCLYRPHMLLPFVVILCPRLGTLKLRCLPFR